MKTIFKTKASYFFQPRATLIYVRMLYVEYFFISQSQQHKSNSKHKNTLKADKKKAVKNDTQYMTCKQYIVQILGYNKCHYNPHAYSTLNHIYQKIFWVK